MERFEACGVESCPALDCLVVALLWRLGRGAQVITLLRSRRKGGDRGEEEIDGVLAFADMLLIIATEVELGAGSTSSKKNKSK